MLFSFQKSNLNKVKKLWDFIAIIARVNTIQPKKRRHKNDLVTQHKRIDQTTPPLQSPKSNPELLTTPNKPDMSNGIVTRYCVFLFISFLKLINLIILSFLSII